MGKKENPQGGMKVSGKRKGSTGDKASKNRKKSVGWQEDQWRPIDPWWKQVLPLKNSRELAGGVCIQVTGLINTKSSEICACTHNTLHMCNR